MNYRSWLLVPGDSERKLASVFASEADVLLVDFEDSVAMADKAAARRTAGEWLKAHRMPGGGRRRAALWVRINTLESRMWRDDLLAAMPGAPEGIVLPKASSPEAVRQIAAELYEIEQRNGVMAGSTQIVALAGSMAGSALGLGTYVEASLPRLSGLGWEAGNLAAALGATRTRDSNGGWTDALRLARAQVLLAAHALGVMAIETPHLGRAADEALEAAASEARADGFSGMLAVHPSQVPAINRIFTPDAAELDEARRVLAAFEANPGVGSLAFDRRTVGPAQLRHARRMLGVEAMRDDDKSSGPILRSA